MQPQLLPCPHRACTHVAKTPLCAHQASVPPKVNKPVIQGPKGPIFLCPWLQVSLVLNLLLQPPLPDRLMWVGKKGYPWTLLQATFILWRQPGLLTHGQCLYLPHPCSHLSLRHRSLKTPPCHSHMGCPGLSSYKHSFSHQLYNASLWGFFPLSSHRCTSDSYSIETTLPILSSSLFSEMVCGTWAPPSHLTLAVASQNSCSVPEDMGKILTLQSATQLNSSVLGQEDNTIYIPLGAWSADGGLISC